jgi:hypothetical protein
MAWFWRVLPGVGGRYQKGQARAWATTLSATPHIVDEPVRGDASVSGLFFNKKIAADDYQAR